MKYLKRPTLVDAIQFNSGDVSDIIKFLGFTPIMDFHDSDEIKDFDLDLPYGHMTVYRGEWIVKDSEGRLSVYSHTAFIHKYDPVE